MPKSHNNISESEGALRKALAGILLGDSDTAHLASRTIEDSNGWAFAIQMAARWSVIPRLVERQRELDITLPPDDQAQLRRFFSQSYARSAYRAAQGVAALNCLEKAGIRAAAFKGLASVALLYGGPDGRTIGDSDVLVAEPDLPAAAAALIEAGFTQQESFAVAVLDRFAERAPKFAGNKAIVFTARNRAEIDLHWSVGLGSVGAAEILSATETCLILGQPVRVVSPLYGALLTARHAIREDFSPDMMFRDLLDLRLWLKAIQSRGQMIPFVLLARQAGCLASIGAAALIAARFDRHAAGEAAELQSSLTPHEEHQALDLAFLFQAQLSTGSLGRDLVWLCHGKPLHSIFSALTNWSEHRAVMRSMETRIDGRELPLRQRLGNLVSDLRRSGFGKLRRVRTLSRLKYDSR